MRDIIVKIMVEVLGIFAIVTKEIKQNPASESTTDDTIPVTDQGLEKFFKKVIGRKDVEEALSRLDKLTREEFQTAIAQVLKVTHDVSEGVKNVGEKVDGINVKVDGVGGQVKDIGDKVNVAVEGTFKCVLYSETPSKIYIRLVLDAAKEKEIAERRSCFFRTLPLVVELKRHYRDPGKEGQPSVAVPA